MKHLFIILLVTLSTFGCSQRSGVIEQPEQVVNETPTGYEITSSLTLNYKYAYDENGFSNTRITFNSLDLDKARVRMYQDNEFIKEFIVDLGENRDLDGNLIPVSGLNIKLSEGVYVYYIRLFNSNTNELTDNQLVWTVQAL